MVPFRLCMIACPVQVNPQAVEQFIRVVGEKEDMIFQRRMRMLQRDKRRREEDKVHMNEWHFLSCGGCCLVTAHKLDGRHLVSQPQVCVSVCGPHT